MDTNVLHTSQPDAIDQAVEALREGGVAAFPTDTVYGMGALAFDEAGIRQLYSIKGRDFSNPIAILLSDIEAFDQVAKKPSDDALLLAARFWPGALTIVTSRHPDVPDLLSAAATIGVRVPDHPVTLKLLGIVGPMAVTSANLSGEENTVSAREVLAQLQGRVQIILDGGAVPGGQPSTVVDCTQRQLKILRPGPISEAELLAALI